MKLFTFGLWQELQGKNAQRAEREWERRSSKYLSRMATLKSRLGESAYRFFTRTGLHDYQLTSVVTDRPQRLDFILARDGEMFVLQLLGVTKWFVNYTGARNGLELGRPFEWGYEEFSAIGRGRLQLDVLFSSGATFTVQFSRLRLRRRRSA